MDLNIAWFVLIGVLLVGYSILDGFDLGAGILQLFTKNDEEKKILLKSIAPFWDGNEVWLLTGGGALFAAFPHVYATVFSGFYLALMLLLVALIFRALSIEFRNQVESQGWKNFWDKAFSISSLVTTLLLGVALGNIFTGIPLDNQMNYTGSFFTLLRPLPLLIGLAGVAMFCVQGAAYLLLKTEGSFYQNVQSWAKKSWALFIALIVLTTLTTAVFYPSKVGAVFSSVFGWLAVLILVYGVVTLPIFLKKEYNFKVFISSSLVIVSMFLIVGVVLFPNMVPALDPLLSLTIYNASSSQLTLKVTLIIALLGMPFVVFYTTYVYRVFRK
ncbi:cytochrome d ubiquinol oxidase subunit II [bacterium]|nr:cytochrome d ubiquinol oxidase subunit II [bacterium]